ncbi:MAG: HAD hydrolase-like protein [Pseudomonadota bacterium]
MREHIFFDLDGTLTDPREGITGCIQHALRELQVHVPPKDELEWCIGPPLFQSFVALAGEENAQAGVDHYRDRFDVSGWCENEPYEGIHDVLQHLRESDRNLYVASSKPLVFVERILKHFALADFFVGVYGSELDGRLSDKSELLAHALKRENLVGSQCVMLGDRKHDAIGAANNDMDFVGVLWGYGSASEFVAAGADRVFNAVHDIRQLGG